MLQGCNFYGICCEAGQRRTGLNSSPNYFRSQMKSHEQLKIYIEDQGDLVLSQDRPSQAVGIINEWSNSYRNLFNQLLKTIKQNRANLFWGGDHSLALVTIATFLRRYPQGKIVWIDAHGDMNTPESSPSGNLHGMPLAFLMDIDNCAGKYLPWLDVKLRPENILMLGVRDLDPYEKHIKNLLNFQLYSALELRQMAPAHLESLIRDFVGNESLHISFDIDSVDPSFAKSTGVLARDGFTPTEIYSLAKILGQVSTIRSVDIVEFNPTLGTVEEISETFDVCFQFLKESLRINKGAHYEKFNSRDQRANNFAIQKNSQIQF